MLLAPKSTDYPYYAEFGWIGAGNDRLPGRPDASGRRQGSGTLSPGHPVTLTWDNGQGLVFTRTIAVDDQYMFTVTDSVANKIAAQRPRFIPMPMSRAKACPRSQHYWVLHVGFVGVANGS